MLSLTTTIGHLRREDRVSQILTATLRDLQIELGISTPIFKANPSDYTYITKNTRWVYTWRMCYSLQITVEFWGNWVPQSAYHNDKNLMLTALSDRYYAKTNNYRLVSINRCRLYLQCFFSAT